MALFSFGKSKNSAQSTSSNFGYGYDGSSSFSDSLSQARSVTGGQSTSAQSIAFEDLYQKLFGSATGAAASAAEAAPILQGQAAQLFSGGVDFLAQLQGGPGTDALAARIGDTSARDAQLEALQAGLGDLFNEELNPAITGRAVAAGQLGGGRQGVAQAQAAKAIAGQYAQGASSIIASDQAQRDQAATSLAGLQQGGAAAGLSALPGLFGVGQGAAMAGLAPYEALAQILGGPTVLTQGQSTQFGQSSSDAIARAISEAFGEDFQYGTSQSSSKGSSFNFGIGGFGGGGS